MSNNISIVVSGEDRGASKELLGIGDAAKKTEHIIVKSMGSTEEAFDTAVRSSGKFGAALETAEGGTGKLAEGIGGVSDAAASVGDLMSASARSAMALSRAQVDVEQAANDAAQAIEDMSQANRDAAQSGIDAEQAAVDLKQALFDQREAQEAYNEAVKEHGRSSREAVQASIDLKQASVDVKQAREDQAQAERDGAQAAIDGKQSMIDQKNAANDLTEAQKELESQSSIIGKITNWTGMLSGVLTGLVGVIGTVTAVQWAWNLAMTANPIGLVIAGIAALIAIVVVIATKTDWFQRLWKAIWSKIGEPAKAAWKQIRNATSSLFDWFNKIFNKFPKTIGGVWKGLTKILTSPFRIAFNTIASLWNNTVGRLSFSVPSWIPGIGGESFDMPSIPSYAVGSGDVLKSGLAMIHRGERVVSEGQKHRLANERVTASAVREMLIRLVIDFDGSFTDSKFMALIIEGIRAYVKNNTGNVQLALGRGKGR